MLFRALPVRQGDAFLIQDGDFSLLVDGGKSRQLLPRLVADAYPSSLNAIACTHNDADHANGLIGLLASSQPAPSEVWLPGSWTSNLHQVLGDPRNVLEQIFEEANAAPEMWDYAEENQTPELRDGAVPNQDSDAIDAVLDAAIEAMAEEPPLPSIQQNLNNYYLRWPWFRRRDHYIDTVLFAAVEAAERIRAIASLAWRAGSRIRWLDVLVPPSAVSPTVRCINAGQSSGSRAAMSSLLAYLALTTSNRDCLTFEVSETDDHPAVILTGDSDLAFDHTIQWGRQPLITAPHHGSDANAKAYRRVEKECGALPRIWVRSDGAFRTRPGRAYLAERARGFTTFCTRCRPKYHALTVSIAAGNGDWLPSSQVCSCV